MIKSFKDKETEKVWKREYSKKLPEDIQERSLMKLHHLKGDRTGQHSIRVNKQWRICFKWNAGHASDVEITDYH
jgi:toxin HigB-1